MKTKPDSLGFLEAMLAENTASAELLPQGVRGLWSEKKHKILSATVVSVVWEKTKLLLAVEMPGRKKYRRLRRYPEATKAIYGAVASIIMDVPNAKNGDNDHQAWTLEDVVKVSFPSESGRAVLEFRVAERTGERLGWCACDGEAKFSYIFHGEYSEKETEVDYGGEDF